MTPSEIQELRDWLAVEVMGYRVFKYFNYDAYFKEVYIDKEGITHHTLVCLYDNWQPDNPDTGQIWLLVERMRALNWVIHLRGLTKEGKSAFAAWFTPAINATFNYWAEPLGLDYHYNPCLAICLAARKAKEGK